MTVLVKLRALPDPSSRKAKTSNAVPSATWSWKLYCCASGVSMPWMTWRGEYWAASSRLVVPLRMLSGTSLDGRKRTVSGLRGGGVKNEAKLRNA